MLELRIIIASRVCRYLFGWIVVRCERGRTIACKQKSRGEWPDQEIKIVKRHVKYITNNYFYCPSPHFDVLALVEEVSGARWIDLEMAIKAAFGILWTWRKSNMNEGWVRKLRSRSVFDFQSSLTSSFPFSLSLDKKKKEFKFPMCRLHVNGVERFVSGASFHLFSSFITVSLWIVWQKQVNACQDSSLSLSPRIQACPAWIWCVQCVHMREKANVNGEKSN